MDDDKVGMKERHVHAVFQKISEHYDVMNDILSFRQHKRWRKVAMHKMDMQPGDTALDLCCGTCDWTISMAKMSRTGAIFGLDFSNNMLEMGHTKVLQQKLQHQITLMEGNVMQLPFANDTFHYVTIGFGLRNVGDIKQVLCEMERVTKPGGKVVCLELSKPTRQPFKSMYYIYFKKVLPFLAGLFARSYDQYSWLPKSLVDFPNLQQLHQLFCQIGLQRVESYALTGGIAALHMGMKGSSYD